MDPFKIITALGTFVILIGLAVTLGRILQSLDDLKHKVDSSLDPEKGVIKQLRERSHDNNNKHQEHVNRYELLKQEFAASKREMDREFSVLRQQINIDNKLAAIQSLIQGQRQRGITPMHGLPKPTEDEE